MSIQTELTRIINAKAAIKTAVEGKGVTVPDGTLLDGMASLIESIAAGGGAKSASGTFTPTNTPVSYQVTHNLGVVPNFALIWQDASYSTVDGTMFIGLCFENKQSAWNITANSDLFSVGNATYDISGTSPASYPTTCYGIAAYAATNSTIKFGNENKTGYTFANKKYYWLVGVL